MGHGFGAVTPEQEIEAHVQVFNSLVKPRELNWYRGHSAYKGDIKPGTRLIIYDFGGMMPGSSLMEDNARELVKYAADNPTCLIVVVSTFSFTNFVKYAVEDAGLDGIANIVVDSVEDPLPMWWRLQENLDTPNLDNVLETRLKAECYPTPDEDVEESIEQPKVVEEPIKPQEKSTKAPIVGTITVDVRMDWEPGQTSGTARFKLADSIVDVENDETGERIASLGGTFFGFYECTFPDNKGESWTYSVDPRVFYAEFEKLHKKRLKDASSDL